MMNTYKALYFATVFFIAAIFFPIQSVALDIEAITKPSADIELSFIQPGKIHSLSVKEGDTVEKGDLLARQEDEIERIQFEILKAKAQNTTRIKLNVINLSRFVGKILLLICREVRARSNWSPS
jgi:multidrug efflux pump subunit AcrA (membrane-fusion protein)